MSAFNFIVDALNELVYVGALHAPITSALASNVQWVYYNAPGAPGGQVLYNDRPAIPEAFSDPSPYQTYIDAFITGYSGLTLAQAKTIKGGLVSAIYDVKRQANVTVTLSSGSKTFDGSDAAVAQYAALASFVVASNLNTVVGDINTVVGELNSADASSNALVTSFNNFVAQWNSADATLTAQVPGYSGFPTSSFGGSFPGSVGTFGSFTASGTIQLVPVGATAALTLTGADMQVLINAIQAQRLNEAVVNAGKQAAVTALSTIAAVVAYDATTGW